MLKRRKSFFGYMTGDIVKAEVKTGKKQGKYRGRVAVRASGSFNISTDKGIVQGISYKSCRKIQGTDGYNYYIERRKPAPFCRTSHRRDLREIQ